MVSKATHTAAVALAVSKIVRKKIRNSPGWMLTLYNS